MINVSETIKNLRKEYNLTQEQFSRAINCDSSTISKWEHGTRYPDIERFNDILNKFGYDLKLTLVEKVGLKKDTAFYKEKTYSEINSMEVDDLVDYIFVTQELTTLSTICNIPIRVIEYISFEHLRILIKESIIDIDRLALYFMINNKYSLIEDEMVFFIKHIKFHLKNLTFLGEDVISKIEYVSFKTDYYSEDGYEDGYYHFFDMKFFDIDMNILDISQDDIDGDIPLDDCLSSKIGKYLFDNDDIVIQLNY